MTLLLYRDDAYLTSADATVVSVNERGGIVVDRSIFYATAGGQPGDVGLLHHDGGTTHIATTIYDENKNVVLVPAEPAKLPKPGSSVRMELDWVTRYRNMRAHTLMHLLCANVPFPVTGGAISEDGGRIDFDIPDGQIPDKAELAARIVAMIEANHPVSARWISDEEMLNNSHLIRTMSVKPPMGTGRVRLVMIGDGGSIDLQPCGGTHVRSTAEIGRLSLGKIEKKGAQNRRVNLLFAQ